MEWAKEQNFKRYDVQARVAFVEAMLHEQKVHAPRCMDLMVPHEIIQKSGFLKFMVAMKPACMGTGTADFGAFQESLEQLAGIDKEEQIQRRLHEWFLSGFCCNCQRQYIEVKE